MYLCVCVFLLGWHLFIILHKFQLNNIVFWALTHHSVLMTKSLVFIQYHLADPLYSLFLHLPTFLSGNHYSVFCICVFILLIIFYIPQMSEIIQYLSFPSGLFHLA